jgi:hypothetical protein
MTEIDNWGEPTDATKQKDALIRELMDGRHRDLDKMREMKALIRELEQAVAFADDNRTFQAERADKAEALIRDLTAALEEAIEGFQEGGHYKGDYLRDKHGDAEDIERLRTILARAKKEVPT